MTTVIGLMAAFLTTLAFVPQVIHILKTKKTDGISLAMYSAFTSGVALWLAYGFMVMDLPVILANAVTLVLALIVLGLTLYSRRPKFDLVADLETGEC